MMVIFGVLDETLFSAVWRLQAFATESHDAVELPVAEA
jgi:hypothetical protein